jgi:serine/threonine-protein kinase HipA
VNDHHDYTRPIYAYLDTQDFAQPVLLGTLYRDRVRGKEVFSFQVSDEWLASGTLCSMLDPDLGRFSGRQYVRDGKVNFGIFLDSAPDRWGRMLIKRREALLARTSASASAGATAGRSVERRSTERKATALYESDFLLNVYDGSRMGALRLKTEPSGDFLDNRKELAIPPWASIRELEYASLCMEQADEPLSREYEQWLNMLTRPGSSLGGARPKANIADQDGNLWIAKFPSANDDKDVGAWEKVVNELAADCGINVSPSMARCFSSRQHTFLVKRFDRNGAGRIHLASAMTLLGAKDGADADSGVSYLDLAGIIIRYGADITHNLEELWRRMVFNIAISNCDDHLRNHAFLLSASGWTLAPAYDLNPDEQGTGLKLNITEHDNALDATLAFEVLPYFRLSPQRAASILRDIKTAVARWDRVAEQYAIPLVERTRVAPAFSALLS